MPDRTAAIAGVHEYPDRKVDGLSKLQIKAASAASALADAGLTWSDVDALYDAGEAGAMSGTMVAEYFGITPRVIDTTAVGGSSYQFHAAHAARDIASGRAKVALLTYGSTAKSDSRAVGTGGRTFPEPTPATNMEVPYGLTLVGNYALVAQRHMYEHGTTAEQLAEIAVTTRAHAARNPDAVRGLEAIGIKQTGEITIDDVLSSRTIADPLHLLECCLVTDGGGAVVIVAADVARTCASHRCGSSAPARRSATRATAATSPPARPRCPGRSRSTRPACARTRSTSR
jgi:acetyl-CoA C-acetyltransferase